MITCTLEPLTGENEKALREWLKRPQCEVLRRVVESQMKRFSAKALTEALQSDLFQLKLDAANGSLLMAQRYQTFLEVLTEVEEQKDGYKTAKLT